MARLNNFYPRPLRGGRQRRARAGSRRVLISIHALCEEGDLVIVDAAVTVGEFLSTPSARRATKFKYPKQPDLEISIHALCEEGDTCSTPSRAPTRNFYPRPLRGGRLNTPQYRYEQQQFLSTPSARRATVFPAKVWIYVDISIHALCEEGDRRCTPRRRWP